MHERTISTSDLIERVALPIGNFCTVLDELVSPECQLTFEQKEAGLRIMLSNAWAIRDFLLDRAATTERLREPKTPQQLREFVRAIASHDPQAMHEVVPPFRTAQRLI